MLLPKAGTLLVMDTPQPIAPAARIGRLFARCDRLEQRWCLSLNRWSGRPAVRHFFAAISRLGDGVFWYTLMVLLPVVFATPGLLAAGHMALTGLVGLAVYKTLKSRLVRERPFIANGRIVCQTPPLDRYSFPSGHTLQAVLFSTVAIAWFPVLALLLVPFAMLVAMSRVILGLHYPSDVVVGAALGLTLALIALGLFPPILHN